MVGVPASAGLLLTLTDTRITNAGLAHLERLSSLRYLSLQDTSVTDAGLAHLEGLPNLQEVDLDGTKVTDAGVTELRRTQPKVKVIR
jgi:hypothetical protein